MDLKDGIGTFLSRLPQAHMIRSVRSTPEHLASVADEHTRDEVRILREIVSALCERVELLEAHAALARPHLVGRSPR